MEGSFAGGGEQGVLGMSEGGWRGGMGVGIRKRWGVGGGVFNLLGESHGCAFGCRFCSFEKGLDGLSDLC